MALPFFGIGMKTDLSSPVATAGFSKFAGILSAALSQHHLSGFGIAQLEFHHGGGHRRRSTRIGERAALAHSRCPARVSTPSASRAVYGVTQSRIQLKRLSSSSSSSILYRGLGRSFPGGLDGKESTCNGGDLGSIPGLGRSPGDLNFASA